MTAPTDRVAYKLLHPAELAVLERDGVFAGSPVDLADGYIHMSTAAQVDGTLAKHFAGVTELCIAAVDLDRLGNAVRWEPAKGGQLYPHFYGRLSLDFVLARGPLERNDDGSVRLPLPLPLPRR